MSFDGARLTLEGASPGIIYFCDRPVREAGHLTWDALMELGGSGKDSLRVDEPNAAVSVFGPDGGVIEAVIRCDWTPVRVWFRAPNKHQPRRVFCLAGLIRCPAGAAC
jgi:hypothetical protein